MYCVCILKYIRIFNSDYWTITSDKYIHGEVTVMYTHLQPILMSSLTLYTINNTDLLPLIIPFLSIQELACHHITKK